VIGQRGDYWVILRKTHGAKPMKPAPNTENLEQDLKTSPEWRARLNTWSIYAAATGATLAMASNADASIIYGVANVSASVAPNAARGFSAQTFQIGGRTALIEIAEFQTGGFRSIFAEVGGVASNLFFANRGSNLINFSQGQSILPASAFARYGVAKALVGSTGFGTFTAGNLASGQTGFAGFVLATGSSNSQFDFGWLRIKVSDPTSAGYVTEIQALDWAYNDTAFAPIAAGEGAVPEPGTAALALLASGAAGLLAWRRRRRA
jgi:hypothetical protein